MKNKTKMLYMMHVSWFWIKQRPQFLAEHLSEFFKIDVACLEDYNKNSILKIQNNENLFFHSFITIKHTCFDNFFGSRINFYIKQIQLFFLMRNNSMLWFTSPVQYLLAKKFIQKKHFVIYDCMDDHSGFFECDTMKANIARMEKGLCNRADYVITSAHVLKSRIISNYKPACPVSVINNALSSLHINKILDSNIKVDYPIFEHTDKKKITYIGTVSKWFDFKLVTKVLDNHKECQLILVGPLDIEIFNHPQIEYLGPVPHDKVKAIMDVSDVLIMPFVVNDLIRAVNPVKAYEYISSGKPVILTKYEETIAFDEYVYLYNDFDELNTIFDSVQNGFLYPKKNLDTCIEFAKKHTWELRAAQINSLINSHIH
jgi:teichuronic acid biosynthesis glycosyltransferase TuaH